MASTIKRGTISPKIRFDVLKRDGFKCVYCGGKSPDVTIEIDHIVPVANGGKTIFENLQAACRDCNAGKRTEGVVVEQSLSTTNLVGMFFHTFYDKNHEEHPGSIKSQGVITDDLGSGYFMVQFYEWMTGSPSFHGTRMFHISVMASEEWSFYTTDEDMRDAYKYGGRSIR